MVEQSEIPIEGHRLRTHGPEILDQAFHYTPAPGVSCVLARACGSPRHMNHTGRSHHHAVLRTAPPSTQEMPSLHPRGARRGAARQCQVQMQATARSKAVWKILAEAELLDPWASPCLLQ